MIPEQDIALEPMVILIIRPMLVVEKIKPELFSISKTSEKGP